MSKFDPYVDIPPSALKHLRTREGFRSKVYQGEKDKPGVLTVGTGHKLTPEELEKWPLDTEVPRETLNELERKDMTWAWDAAGAQAEELGIPELREALFHVNFQLGPSWYKIHKKTWGFLKEGELEKAAVEAADSRWYELTPERVEDLQNSLRDVARFRNRLN